LESRGGKEGEPLFHLLLRDATVRVGTENRGIENMLRHDRTTEPGKRGTGRQVDILILSAREDDTAIEFRRANQRSSPGNL